MTVDDSRLEAKGKGAVVIDIDEIRARRNLEKNALITPLDPETKKSVSFWIMLALTLAVVIYFMRRA